MKTTMKTLKTSHSKKLLPIEQQIEQLKLLCMMKEKETIHMKQQIDIILSQVNKI
jgi:hypothetical protein